jgi:hypothetical protein
MRQKENEEWTQHVHILSMGSLVYFEHGIFLLNLRDSIFSITRLNLRGWQS